MKLRVIAILLSLSVFSSLISAQDISKQTEQKKKLEDEIALINSQLSATKNRQKQDVNSLQLTQKKIAIRKELIAQIDGEIRSYDLAIASKNKDIERLTSRLDTLRRYHDKLIYNAYKNRDSKIWFMYIMASENINQGIRRWSYLKNLSVSVRSQSNAIKEAQHDLESENEKLRKLKAQSLSIQKEKEQEFLNLSTEEANLTKSINSLNKEEKKIKASLNQKKKEMEKLNKEIERILAQAVKEQKKGGKAEVDIVLSSRFSDNKGKFPWPVRQGVIVEKFGTSYHPVFKNIKLPFNNGVNISAAEGSKALCIFDGVVKQVLVMPGYNQCVLVQHGEYFTFYCKLKKVIVKGGDKIATGQEIGTIDTAEGGNSIIHFQLWKGTEKQNPENWLRK